jgi:hypothetical protein
LVNCHEGPDMTQRTAERQDQLDKVKASESPGRKAPPDSGRPRSTSLLSNLLPLHRHYAPALQRLVTPQDEDMPGKVCVRAGWCRPRP